MGLFLINRAKKTPRNATYRHSSPALNAPLIQRRYDFVTNLEFVTDKRIEARDDGDRGAFVPIGLTFTGDEGTT
jgi:hypothetical protein